MGQTISEVCKQLEPFLDIIYDNEDLFLNAFAPEADYLVEVHFSMTHFKYIFILPCGQYIVNEKPLSELVDWFFKLKN